MTGAEQVQVVMIGAGRMGGALLRGLPAGTAASYVDPAVAQMAGAARLGGVADIAGLSGARLVVLAVKPAMVPAVAAELAPVLSASDCVLSIAAGVRLERMRAALGDGPSLVRAMPNLAVAVGKGMIAAIADGAANAVAAGLPALFAQSGDWAWLEEERLIDVATAISGSGPAYFFYLGELLARAGAAQGLPEAVAVQMARQTLIGAGAYADAEGRPLGALRDEVTSPNGTTAAALDRWGADDALGRLTEAAVAAAFNRAEELAG